MSRRHPQVKLADVAARAGVSVSAVSLVMNGNDAGNIAAATRERILVAARELDYRPNSVAQSLRRKRSHALGLVTDRIATAPFAGRILAGALDTAAERGYVLLMVDTAGRTVREKQVIGELARRQVDGLLYATMGLTRLSRLPTPTMPVVLANCYEPVPTTPTVIPADVDAGRTAARHLIELGHRRIVMLSGPGPEPGTGLGNIAGPLREQGFSEVLDASGHPDPRSAIRVVGWEMDDGYRGGMRVLADAAGRRLPASRRPSAIVAVTDRAASGVMLAAAALGIRVPSDLSIVGFDDQENLADRLTPPLTTLALPHRAMGEAAIDTLLDLIAGTAPHEADLVRLLPCPLVERGSTAPPS